MTAEEIEIMTCADPEPTESAEAYMNRVHATRRLNLARLLRMFAFRSQNQMAFEICMDPAKLSEFFTGKRTISEKQARRIEEQLRMPFGSMDREAV